MHIHIYCICLSCQCFFIQIKKVAKKEWEKLGLLWIRLLLPLFIYIVCSFKYYYDYSLKIHILFIYYLFHLLFYLYIFTKPTLKAWMNEWMLLLLFLPSFLHSFMFPLMIFIYSFLFYWLIQIKNNKYDDEHNKMFLNKLPILFRHIFFHAPKKNILMSETFQYWEDR